MDRREDAPLQQVRIAFGILGSVLMGTHLDRQSLARCARWPLIAALIPLNAALIFYAAFWQLGILLSFAGEFPRNWWGAPLLAGMLLLLLSGVGASGWELWKTRSRWFDGAALLRCCARSFVIGLCGLLAAVLVVLSLASFSGGAPF